MNISLVAAFAHEVNRAYCEAIGDRSQVKWKDAPQWQKDSAIAGVQFYLANEEVTPEIQHDAWAAHKVADGWTYGPVKDAEAKTHPCLVAYDKLPEAQKVKDALFVAVVNAACEAGVI